MTLLSVSPRTLTDSLSHKTVELPVFLALYLFWRLVKGVKSPTLLQIDLDTNRYQETERDKEDNREIERREKGKFGWAWKMYSWIA